MNFLFFLKRLRYFLLENLFNIYDLNEEKFLKFLDSLHLKLPFKSEENVVIDFLNDTVIIKIRSFGKKIV